MVELERLKYFFLWIFTALVLAGFLFYFLSQNSQNKSAAQLNINDEVINLAIARTDAELEHGLYGRAALASNEGMLFIFQADGFWQFWMKDMNFPIDMIWLDSSDKIVGIKENATPDSYPQTFTSQAPARYVLELPAGFAKAHGLIYNEPINVIQK